MSIKHNQIDEYRRQFLSHGAAAAVGLALAPGLLLNSAAQAKPASAVKAKPANVAVTNKVRWGLLIDTKKCATGCTKCVEACNDENGLKGHGRPETDAQWIRKLTLKNKKTGLKISLPFMCQHCESPPCVDVCPTGASFKRADGIVLVDKHICIGCRYCMLACPYKARSFIHETLTDQVPDVPRGKGTVESCTLCVHRIDRGQRPACEQACPESAILFGDLNNPNSKIAKHIATEPSTQIRGDLNLDPGVRYQGI